jgi:threonine dehydrogenase-like Zn-dependent dehydrogenase
MKGFGVIEPGKAGWLEIDKPVAGPLDAVCRPLMLAPCSSDVHLMHGGSGPMHNVVLGHEVIGEVVEVGSLVKKFKPGDVVVIPCTTPNWEEVALQQKDANNAHDAGMMGSFKFILSRPGTFAEFFSVNNADANMVILPDCVEMEDALMTVDMMSTGFYGAEMANIHLGDTVVVFGIGPVGLMAVAGARSLGAGRIIGIGTRPDCVKLAKEYGATDIVSYKEGDIVEQILKLVPEKVDSVILAGGDCSSLNQALQIVRNNGTVSNINNVDIKDVYSIPTPLLGLGMADITIRNGFCPGGALRIQKLLNMIQAGRVKPGKMLNYKFEGFDKIPDAFDVMDNKPRDLIKSVVSIKW